MMIMVVMLVCRTNLSEFPFASVSDSVYQKTIRLGNNSSFSLFLYLYHAQQSERSGRILIAPVGVVSPIYSFTPVFLLN